MDFLKTLNDGKRHHTVLNSRKGPLLKNHQQKNLVIPIRPTYKFFGTTRISEFTIGGSTDILASIVSSLGIPDIHGAKECVHENIGS